MLTNQSNKMIDGSEGSCFADFVALINKVELILSIVSGPINTIDKYLGKWNCNLNYGEFSKNSRGMIKVIPLVERHAMFQNCKELINAISCRLTNKKLRVRGAFKAELFAFAVAIGINYGRIYRLKHGKNPSFREYLYFILKNMENAIIFRVKKVIATIISIININSAINFKFCSIFMGVENGGY